MDTYKTDLAFDRIRRKFTLHLSGTPFKALANDKFAGDAIFNWTYADEQAAKRNWQGEPGQQNPYANLPMLNLYTYQMSEIIRDEIRQGVEIDGKTQEFAFDLNEFFKVKPSGSFEHEAEVDRFLDAMTTQNKFPFFHPGTACRVEAHLLAAEPGGQRQSTGEKAAGAPGIPGL